MRRSAARIAIALIAMALTTAGLVGALSYARDYNVHRGFGSVVQFRRAGTGRLVKVTFFSTALRRAADYLAYLPPHYSVARRYPVYYLLHGMPGQPRVFVDIANMDIRLDDQLGLGRARPMILVYPDGRIANNTFSDSEWANTRSGDFESYVIDVMHNVDDHFATLRRRRDRVIAGFSAGGYGAMNIALHHLADFANVQVWSGYFTQTRTGVFAHAGAAALAANSPRNAIQTMGRALRRYPLRTYLFSGRDDSDGRQLLPMARALTARGVRVAYRFYPGGHDWSVWYPRLDQMLDLASWDIGHPPRAVIAHPAAIAHPTIIADPAVIAHARRHRRRPELRLIGVLLLALASAALINLGFVLQHRGRAHDLAAGRTSLVHALRNRTWLAGQAVGWIGFAGQIVAVALAPLTLVQAFAAGSLAISVPVAARILGQRVGRAQLIAVAVVAVSLAALPVGLGHHHGHLQPGALLMAALVTVLGAMALALRGRPFLQAIASGGLYGVADAAIKADALGVRTHGPSALLSGWTILAALATFGGFLAFQAALRGRDAVQPLSLMNAFTAVTAVALGVGGFGESLGASPAAAIAHVIAIVLVLACVRPLTRAQEHLIHGEEPDLDETPTAEPNRAPRQAGDDHDGGLPGLAGLARAAVTSVGATTAVVIGTLAGVGLLYSLRQLHWLAAGPSVPDALPLLQLAGFAGQPAARLIVAWIPAGVVLGLALIRFPAPRRTLLILMFGAVLLLFASDASYALARNLRLGSVLLSHEPGLGPWVECLLLAAGGTLPWLWSRRRPRAAERGRLPAHSAIPMRPA